MLLRSRSVRNSLAILLVVLPCSVFCVDHPDMPSQPDDNQSHLASEKPVERVIRVWLSRTQEPDGHWDARKYGATAANDTLVTSLALLTFLSGHHTEKTGAYKDNVRRAIAWLKSRQDISGLITDVDGAKAVPGLPTHAIAGFALAEAAGSSSLPETTVAAQKAVDYSSNVHQHTDGGFAQKAKEPGDLATTGWFLIQLKAAKLAGLKVEEISFERLKKFLDSVERKGAGGDVGFGPASIYSNLPGKEQPEGAHRLTAIGCAARQYMGWKREDLLPSFEWLVTKGGIPDSWSEEKTDLVYWYFGTISAFKQGGDAWKRWNEAMKKTLEEAKQKGGDEDGSWAPTGTHAKDLGRVGQTAFAMMCLQVYYRFLKLHLLY